MMYEKEEIRHNGYKSTSQIKIRSPYNKLSLCLIEIVGVFKYYFEWTGLLDGVWNLFYHTEICFYCDSI